MPSRRRACSRAALAALLAGVWPALALAHERWVPHGLRGPVNMAYFRAMRGEVLRFSLVATAVFAGVIVAWYLAAVPVAERLAPMRGAPKARTVAQRLRVLGAVLLDAEIDAPWVERGLRVAAFVFARLPALVLALGVVQRWIIMPSFPVQATAWRAAEAVLAVWAATGRWLRPLGYILIAIFVYLCFAYGIAAIDAIPVLATAFFYVYDRDVATEPVNASQLVGLRVSLGVGFALLGLVNKIYIAPLFIGVGDQFPQLLEGPRHLMPALTRESWSFTTALGEMVFGLLLLVGIFDKLTTLALVVIFAHFMTTFGWPEIVHLYPIMGFVVLFFRGPPGTALDGALFRTHVLFWRLAGRRSSTTIYTLAVCTVALAAAALLVFVPLVAIVQLVPRIFG